jgi:hypothetical protein
MDWSGSNVEFFYEQNAELSSIEPSLGWANKANVVTIHGQGFAESDTFVCRFGNKVYNLTYLSPTMASFVTPVVTSAFNFSVTVSNDGFGFSKHSKTYVMQPADNYCSISPQYGTERGGTRLTIKGFRHYQSWQVPQISVGSLRLQCTGTPENAGLVCITPASQPGVYNVSVTWEGETVEPAPFSKCGTFEFTEEVQLSRAEPPVALAQGGCTLTGEEEQRLNSEAFL